DLRHVELGVLDRHHRAPDRVLEERIELAVVLLVDVLERLEALELASDARRVARRVETGDRPDPGHAGEQRRPELLGGVADGRARPDPGDDDPPPVHARRLPLYWFSLM